MLSRLQDSCNLCRNVDLEYEMQRKLHSRAVSDSFRRQIFSWLIDDCW